MLVWVPSGRGDAAHLKIQIDTTGPITFAKAASGQKGKPVALKSRVTDNLSPKVTAVMLTVRNSHKKVAKRFSFGTKSISTWFTAKWTPKATGTYTVTATDLAGNRQIKAGHAKITVN